MKVCKHSEDAASQNNKYSSMGGKGFLLVKQLDDTALQNIHTKAKGCLFTLKRELLSSLLAVLQEHLARNQVLPRDEWS